MVLPLGLSSTLPYSAAVVSFQNSIVPPLITKCLGRIYFWRGPRFWWFGVSLGRCVPLISRTFADVLNFCHLPFPLFVLIPKLLWKKQIGCQVWGALLGLPTCNQQKSEFPGTALLSLSRELHLFREKSILKMTRNTAINFIGVIGEVYLWASSAVCFVVACLFEIAGLIFKAYIRSEGKIKRLNHQKDSRTWSISWLDYFPAATCAKEENVPKYYGIFISSNSYS